MFSLELGTGSAALDGLQISPFLSNKTLISQGSIRREHGMSWVGPRILF